VSNREIIKFKITGLHPTTLRYINIHARTHTHTHTHTQLIPFV